MLDIIRKQKESIIIKIVFVVIVLSFIGTIFLVWGKGSDGGGGGQSGYAAKVDGTRITLEEYQNSYQRIRNMYQQIYGQSIPPEMEKMLGLKKLAMDNIVDNLLVMKEAKTLGIKASKDEVKEAIAAMSMFQKDGAFSFDMYNQLLKSNRITANDFEDGQRSELILKKTKQSIKDKATVTDGDALAEYKKEKDKLDLEYVGYSPADVFAEVKLSEADLTEFLQKNQNEFMTPEKVALSFVILDPSTQASKISISEEEIQSFYQKNIDRWQGKDGILPLSEVKERVKVEALKQKAAKQLFELAADTLYKNIKSGDINQIASQLGLKIHETQLFTADAPAVALVGENAVVKKSLELKQGELGGPVETSKGIYILKAKERKAASVPPLAEIKSAVEQKTKAAKAVELAKKKAEEAAKQLASKAAVMTQATGSFGFSPKGEIPTIGVAPEMMESVFKLAALQAPAAPFKVGSRWYAVRVKSRTEAPKVEFDRTKEELKKKMLPKKQEEALENWIKELRAKAKIEINQALVAEK